MAHTNRFFRFFFRAFLFTAICCNPLWSHCQKNVDLPPYKNPTGTEFPINAWHSFHTENQITRQNYLEMREAGFNITNTQTDFKELELTLKAVENTGVKVLVNTGVTRNIEKLPNYIPKVRNNPNIIGYFISDEPVVSKFDLLKRGVALIREYDDKHLCFVNLLPMVEPSRLGAPSYKKYLEEAVEEIRLSLFSYDNYPIIKKGGRTYVSDTFYENLEIASQVATELDRPFWAFCCSSSHLVFPSPTLAYLSFEAFSAIAYGAQGLSYYTYQQKTQASEVYKDAPVMANGKRTKIWNYCKEVNTQIHNLEHIFLGCRLMGAWHTGNTIPKGTRRLEKLPAPYTSLTTGKGGVLVSHLNKDGKDYLMIVNHEISGSQKITLTSSSPMTRHEGSGQTVDMGTTATIKLSAGGYALFSCE